MNLLKPDRHTRTNGHLVHRFGEGVDHHAKTFIHVDDGNDVGEHVLEDGEGGAMDPCPTQYLTASL